MKKLKKIRKNLQKTIDKTRNAWYNIHVRQRGNPETKGSEEMNEEMTNAQFDAFLETLAKRIENEAETPEEAAAIVREAKTEK